MIFLIPSTLLDFNARVLLCYTIEIVTMISESISLLCFYSCIFAGRYAVAIHWSDGHASSIYPFSTLLELEKAPG
jgi:hypothetical protein